MGDGIAHLATLVQGYKGEKCAVLPKQKDPSWKVIFRYNRHNPR